MWCIENPSRCGPSVFFVVNSVGIAVCLTGRRCSRAPNGCGFMTGGFLWVGRLRPTGALYFSA